MASSSAPLSGFPHFIDGDVLIVISTTQWYQLHLGVLTARSPYFANQIATKPGARLNAAAIKDHAAPYRFDFQRGNDGNFGEFVHKVRGKNKFHQLFTCSLC
jgi:hypothetical protein